MARDQINQFIIRLRVRMHSSRGAVMAEYGLLIALIAVMLVAVLGATTAVVTGMFSSTTETLNTSNVPAP